MLIGFPFTSSNVTDEMASHPGMISNNFSQNLTGSNVTIGVSGFDIKEMFVHATLGDPRKISRRCPSSPVK